MKDVKTEETIQLTRIHALDWYGFSGSFDLAGQTLITGVYGCGKTALIDLIQTVLLGPPEHDNRYNLSVGDVGGTARAARRDLRGYALQDMNIMREGNRVFARQNTRTYIALEWTWPDANRRETWGLRIEFSSSGADAVIDYWRVPVRLEFDDFLAEETSDNQVPLAGDAWLRKLGELQGQRYSTRADYLEAIAATQHLNFDARVFKPLLLQTLRFSFGSNFNEFCREHILPEMRIDIEAVKESYDRYCEFVVRLRLLGEQQEILEKITAAFNTYHRLEGEISALGWFRQNFLVEEKRSAAEKASAEYAEVRQRYEKWAAEMNALKTKQDEAQSAVKEINARLGSLPNAQEFTHFKERQQALPEEIARLEQSLGDPASLIRQSFEHLLVLAEQANGLSTRQNWTVPVLPADYPTEVPDKLDVSGIETLAAHIESAAGTFAERWKDLAKEAEAEKSLLENREAALRRDLDRLNNNRSPENLILHDTLEKKFGREQVELIGDLCEVTDEKWADALEINFTHKLASLVPDNRVAEAFNLFDSFSDINPRERLACRRDFLQLSGEIEPDSLATKITSSDPAVSRLLAHLFGDVRCCDSVAAAEEHPRAILCSGAMKEPTGRRRRQRTAHPEYAIGKKGREKMIELYKMRLADLVAPQEIARSLARETAGLRDGFLNIRTTVMTLRRDKLAVARKLEELRAEQQSLFVKFSLMENREELEDLRQKSRNKQKEADDFTPLIQELVKNAPPNLEEKRQAEIATKEAWEDAEKQALMWQSAHPEGIAAAAKYRALETEVRNQSSKYHPASEVCKDLNSSRSVERESARGEALRLRQQLRDHSRITDFRDSDVDDLTNNTLWEKKLSYIVETGIKDFTHRMEEAEIEWEDRFQKNVLGQLLEQFNNIEQTFRGLQRLIAGRSIGGSQYRFKHNQSTRAEFKLLYELANDLEFHNNLLPGNAEANASIRARRKDAMKLLELASDADSRAIARQRELLDPRCYFTYDLEITEAGRSETVSLNTRGRKGSGGETYNPYLIALITAYMRAFRRHEQGTRPSISLLLMDEAFKVNDSAAVRDCVNIIAQLGLQGVISCTNTVGSQVIEFFGWVMIVQKQVIPAADNTTHDTINNTVFAAPRNDAEVLRIVNNSE
jgi:hypothetical protein